MPHELSYAVGIWTDGRRRTSGLPVMRRVPYAGQVSRTCSVRSIRAMRAEGASGSNAMLMCVSGSRIRPVVPCVRTWDVAYASVTPVDGNAPVRPGGSPDMSDRGGAMRGWTKPVRYGLIRPCPYGTADVRVLSDVVRPGREAGGVRPLRFGNNRPCFVPYRTAGCIRGVRRFPQAFVRICPSGLRSVRRFCRYCLYR